MRKCVLGLNCIRHFLNVHAYVHVNTFIYIDESNYLKGYCNIKPVSSQSTELQD